MYTPVEPQFYYITAGFKGVKIIQACFRDEVFLLPHLCRVDPSTTALWIILFSIASVWLVFIITMF